MGTLTDYFNKIGHKATWEIGDRVSGKWNGIPFVGTVGSETLVNLDFGPRVTIMPDLPIKYNGGVHNVIVTKPKDLKRLKNYDEPPEVKTPRRRAAPADGG